MNFDVNKPDWVFDSETVEHGVERILAKGITARILVGEHSMVSVVRVEPNTAGNIHSHPEEQWGILVSGKCIRIQGDEEYEARVGDFWHTPPNVPHGVRTESERAIILDVFSPAKEHYKSSGEGY